MTDCWQCFDAQGKVCMDAEHDNLFTSNHIQTSKGGQVICCKSDYNEGYCKDGNVIADAGQQPITMVCSPPSFVADPASSSSTYKNVITGNRNHQMFAYCPQISRPKCGIKDDITETYEKHEYHLRAGRDKKTVSATELKYLMQGGHVINGQLKIVSKE